MIAYEPIYTKPLQSPLPNDENRPNGASRYTNVISSVSFTILKQNHLHFLNRAGTFKKIPIQRPPKIMVEVKRLLSLAILSNDPQAQYMLAVYNFKGFGIRRNYLAALNWLTRASNQNHPQAHFSLGCFYLYGVVVEIDLIKARKLFLLASTRGVYAANRYLRKIDAMQPPITTLAQSRQSSLEALSQAAHLQLQAHKNRPVFRPSLQGTQ